MEIVNVMELFRERYIWRKKEEPFDWRKYKVVVLRRLEHHNENTEMIYQLHDEYRFPTQLVANTVVDFILREKYQWLPLWPLENEYLDNLSNELFTDMEEVAKPNKWYRFEDFPWEINNSSMYVVQNRTIIGTMTLLGGGGWMGEYGHPDYIMLLDTGKI